MSTLDLNRSPVTITTIPQELIDTIIDVLKDDIRTLRVCALVSLSFTACCQKNIFSKIRLSAVHGPRIVLQLRSILSKSPHLSQLVKTLSIEDFWSPSIGATISWLSTSRALCTVLSQLLSLRDLTLKSVGAVLQWGRLPEALQVAFGTVMKSGNVGRLVLISVKGFPSTYLSEPSLTNVEMSSSQIETQNGTATPSQRKSLVLPLPHSRWRTFYFEGRNQLLPLISFILSPNSGIDISNLQKLTIRPIYDGFEFDVPSRQADLRILDRFIQRVSHCLRDIWISPIIWPVTPADGIRSVLFNPGFRLGYLPQLQVLNIDLQMQLEQHSPEPSPSYLWHANVFKNICEDRLPRLTTINIVCDFAEADPVEAFNGEFWQQLDSLISKPALKSLKRVNLLYLFDWFQTGDLTPMARLIRQEMKGLVDKGVLRVAGYRGKVSEISPSQASQHL